MAASDELAEKTAQALQLSEGSYPVALEDIAEAVESESVPEQSPDLAISPSLDTSDHLSPANTISNSDLVASLPSLTFDGVSKDEFKAFQESDPSLNPFVPELFGRARKNQIFYRGIEHCCFIFLTRCWLGKPHSNHISLNRPRVWDSPHFLIEKIE